jgi:hypothetical protein
MVSLCRLRNNCGITEIAGDIDVPGADRDAERDCVDAGTRVPGAGFLRKNAISTVTTIFTIDIN